MVTQANTSVLVRSEAINPVFQPTTSLRKRIDRFAIRAFDLAVSGFLLLFLSPLFAAISAAVRWTSRGPAFFKQLRVMEGGKHFWVYKFRTMCKNAESLQACVENEQKGGVIFKNKSDSRVTRVGKWLRRLSLDELPQLWNVFRGEMSLVGPRPHPVKEVDSYPTYAMERLNTKPGLTGLAQINGRSDLSFQETVTYDVDYIQRKSFWLNMWILVRTVRVVLSGKGAY